MFKFACLRLGSSETTLNTGLSSWYGRWSRKAQQGSREVRLGDPILQVCVTKQITAVSERDFLPLGGRGDLFQGLSTTEGAEKLGTCPIPPSALMTATTGRRIKCLALPVHSALHRGTVDPSDQSALSQNAMVLQMEPRVSVMGWSLTKVAWAVHQQHLLQDPIMGKC